MCTNLLLCRVPKVSLERTRTCRFEGFCAENLLSRKGLRVVERLSMSLNWFQTVVSFLAEWRGTINKFCVNEFSLCRPVVVLHKVCVPNLINFLYPSSRKSHSKIPRILFSSVCDYEVRQANHEVINFSNNLSSRANGRKISSCQV